MTDSHFHLPDDHQKDPTLTERLRAIAKMADHLADRADSLQRQSADLFLELRSLSVQATYAGDWSEVLLGETPTTDPELRDVFRNLMTDIANRISRLPVSRAAVARRAGLHPNTLLNLGANVAPGEKGRKATPQRPHTFSLTLPSLQRLVIAIDGLEAEARIFSNDGEGS